MTYEIEIRDKNGKLYFTSKGNKVIEFFFEDEETDENLIHLICQHTFLNYEAVCKEGSTVDIEVRYFDEISKTYSTLYSYYGAEKRFIKH